MVADTLGCFCRDLFDEQHTRPEQVDEARAVDELRDMRLVSRDVLTPHPDHVEEGVVEALRFAVLAGNVLPVVSKGGRVHANLIPRPALHATLPVVRRLSDGLPLAESG